MNENTKGLDVLVVIDAAIQRAAWDAKQYKFPDKDGDQLKKARSAVAELIQKAETAELALRNLVVAGQIDPAYGHYADDLRAALDGIGGGSA